MNSIKKYKGIIGLLFVVAFLMYRWYKWLPDPLFDTSYSTIVYDRSGNLLGARIADDGQWRFPDEGNTLPTHYIQAVLTFEDERFYYHPGIDPLAIGRAFLQNIKAKKVVSGGSTITMQTIRLSQPNVSRTYLHKVKEMLQALRLELSFSKDEILSLYAHHAPFGGNVVGIEAASWRYFSKPINQLSIAECALLAVLPNAPSWIHLSRNREKLKNKRDRLLKRMWERGHIDQTSFELGCMELIPKAPKPLPDDSRPLVNRLFNNHPGKAYHTTIDGDLQARIKQIAIHHHRIYHQESIHNIGILVADTKSGEVLSYIGNTDDWKHEGSVDMIASPRSTGSILKPLLYASMLDEGFILPSTLIPDIPTNIGGYSPMNYDKQYLGACPADEALAKSLNIPSVKMLQQFGIEKFLIKLRQMGLTSINRSADDYGLSLILGGAESSLWEICGAYASMGRTLNGFNQNQKYNQSDFRSLSLFNNEIDHDSSYKPNVLSAGAIYWTLKAMQTVKRPISEGRWDTYASNRKLSWKTGTSYGHKDAWAVGVSPKYTIGIWVGNADGEGRYGLVGIQKAAPILFDVLNRLQGIESFEEPIDDLKLSITCTQSGFLAGRFCNQKDSIYAPANGYYQQTCPYHQQVFLDHEGYQSYHRCSNQNKLSPTSWFVLPENMAFYYRKNHPEYVPLPPFNPNCTQQNKLSPIAILYPPDDLEVFIPKDLDGKEELLIVQATHQQPLTKVYWHLNDKFLGTTTEHHEMRISSRIGSQNLTLTDEHGHSISRTIHFIGGQTE